jgi:hypothetical protein
MKNYDLTVEELKEKKIVGIKLPGSIDDFGFTVKDGNKIEVPIHGVQNGTVELELLGRADTIEFVAEEKKEDKAETVPPVVPGNNEVSTSERPATTETTGETAHTETATETAANPGVTTEDTL